MAYRYLDVPGKYNGVFRIPRSKVMASTFVWTGRPVLKTPIADVIPTSMAKDRAGISCTKHSKSSTDGTRPRTLDGLVTGASVIYKVPEDVGKDMWG